MLSAWKLHPNAPASPFWEASSHKGDVIIRTPNEARARMIANTLFGKAHERPSDGQINFFPWGSETEISGEQLVEGTFAAGTTEAILSSSYYDEEFREKLKSGAIRPVD